MKLALPASFAILLVVGSPFVGRLREIVAAAFPASFDAIVAASIALAIVVTTIVSLARIRERRRLRYLAIASALVAGAACFGALRTGDTATDVVEAFHFVEFGALTLSFYLAWYHYRDGAVVVLPALAGLLVGIVDEWVQWFIPSRVGELRDLLIDAVAVGCGLLFAIGFKPPVAGMVFRPGSPVRVGWMSVLVIGVFGLFFQSAHLGHQLADPGIGVFRSRYTAAELESAARQRTDQWAASPAASPGLLSREDQYMSEGLWHVRRRNMALADGDVVAAWHENRILEVFFTPILDRPSSRGAPLKWMPEQRADVARQAESDPRVYVSTAEPYPIYPWPKATFWAFAATAMVAVIAVSLLANSRIGQLRHLATSEAAGS